MIDTKKQLGLVRRYTGEAFSAKRGYDARKPMSFGRRMAVLKYYRKIVELTTGADTVVYKPKRGEKTSAFNYTGQHGFRKFDVAIVRKINPEQDFEFTLDKSLPAGHQFIAIDRQTGRRFVNLPAYLFNGSEIDAAEYQQIIETYAPDAEYYLIQAGESYMWGSGGASDDLADKLATIFRNYSAEVFDPNNRNSSYFGNWFRGVSAFARFDDVEPAILRHYERRDSYEKRFHKTDRKKYRRTRMFDQAGNPLMGVYENGELIKMVPIKWDEEIIQSRKKK